MIKTRFHSCHHFMTTLIFIELLRLFLWHPYFLSFTHHIYLYLEFNNSNKQQHHPFNIVKQISCFFFSVGFFTLFSFSLALFSVCIIRHYNTIEFTFDCLKNVSKISQRWYKVSLFYGFWLDVVLHSMWTQSAGFYYCLKLF